VSETAKKCIIREESYESVSDMFNSSHRQSVRVSTHEQSNNKNLKVQDERIETETKKRVESSESPEAAMSSQAKIKFPISPSHTTTEKGKKTRFSVVE